MSSFIDDDKKKLGLDVKPVSQEKIESIRIPVGGRILVKLIKTPDQDRQSDGGVFLPDIAENTQDCEGIVLAVSSAPGYELPRWVAERCMDYVYDCYAAGCIGISAEGFMEECAQPREPRVKVGDRIVFDITLATLAPGSEGEDEFFVKEEDIFLTVDEDCPKIELTKLQADPSGYRIK